MRRLGFPRVSCVLVVTALLVATTRATAEPTAQERGLADTLFRDAKAMVTAGNVGPACLKFAESQRLDPQVGTLLYLATCHQQEGKTASAWVEFNDAAHAAHAAGQADRETMARSRAVALEPKLSHLTVRIAKAVDAQAVKVDGLPLNTSAWGASFPVDPGKHVVEASAPARTSWRKDMVLDAGSQTVIDIPELAPADPGPKPAIVVLPSPAPEQPVAPQDDGGRRTFGFVALGIGGAGLVTGSIFGVLALDAKNQAAKLGDGGGCVGNRCTQAVLDKEGNARTMGWVSTAGFGLGVVGAGVGAWLLLTSGGKEPAKAARSGVSFAPVVNAHDVGMTAVGSF